jgi:methylsterol monooxygenase
VGEDYFNLCVYGSFIVLNTVFWTVGSVYTYFDLTLTPAFLRQYKMQPTTNEPLDRPKFFKLLRTVVFNQTVVFLGFNYVCFHLNTWRGIQNVRILPEFHWVVVELIICVLVEEVAFFYGHWLFHHRLVYKHIHKKHHEWQSSIALVALYAHPLEHIVSNLGPPTLGTLLLGSHIATTWLWGSLALISTLNSHSGYHLPFFPSPEAHDFHHLKFNQCYGVLGILDYLHGTDIMFRSSQAYQRHIILVGSTPLRETFPDPEDFKTKKKVEETSKDA